MKTKDNSIRFRASDDFVSMLESTWRHFKSRYPEYEKVNSVSQFIVCSVLNEMNRKEFGQVIINEMNDGEIPELNFWHTEVEGSVEDVLKEIKAKVKQRKQKKT